MINFLFTLLHRQKFTLIYIFEGNKQMSPTKEISASLEWNKTSPLWHPGRHALSPFLLGVAGAVCEWEAGGRASPSLLSVVCPTPNAGQVACHLA